MPLITEKDVAAVYFGLLLAGILAFPCILAMHFLMPKAVLERYWKEPHFRPMELILFTNTIYAPMRTAMLLGAIAFPRLGRRRKVTKACTLVPRWYRIAAIMLNVWMVAVFAGLLAITFGTNLHHYLIGERALWPMQNGAKVDWLDTVVVWVLVFWVVYRLAKYWKARK